MATSRIASLWQDEIDRDEEKIAILERGNIDPNVSCLSIIATRNSSKGTQSHKTKVASVAACDDPNYKGVAYQAALIDAGYDGTQDGAKALRWAVEDQGVNIVNFSARWETDNQMHKIDQLFDYWAREEAVSIVVAAGNRDGTDNVVSPGKGWNVTTVGALDENGTAHWTNDGIRSRSSFADPVVDDDPPGDREKPEVVAPGQHIVMIDQGSNPIKDSGTSYAAPQVAGLVALLMDRNNRLRDRPNAVKAILLASAVHNVEGDRRLSEQDGVGGMNAAILLPPVIPSVTVLAGGDRRPPPPRRVKAAAFLVISKRPKANASALPPLGSRLPLGHQITMRISWRQISTFMFTNPAVVRWPAQIVNITTMTL